MDWKQQTIRTYDDSAEALAEYFKGIGARTDDIERALELAQAGPEATVVEIGCGDGRDAAEIVPRVGSYIGFDPSEGLLAIARRNLPDARFVLADALSFDYPAGLDVVYAFASLLHVNRRDMRTCLELVAHALRSGGILYVSLKERPEYTEEVKADGYGRRMFYFYNREVLAPMAEDLFDIVYEDHQTMGSTDWITLAFRKR